MSRVKGPKDGTLLTAGFNGKNKKNVPKDHLTKSLVLLSIAGNEYCSGQYLSATAKQATDEFAFTTFLIADEVYWHNLKNSEFPHDKEKNDLQANALQLGENFFKANKEAFLKLFDKNVSDEIRELTNHLSVDQQIELINEQAAQHNKKFEIVRWNRWTNPIEVNYRAALAKMDDYYKNSDLLSSSITLTAQDFANRHKHEGSEELWKVRSKGYLTEESPAVIWLAANLNYNFIVYPGDMIAPFQATKEFFLDKKTSQTNADLTTTESILISNNQDPMLLVNWLDIYFRRSKELDITKSVQSTTTTSVTDPASSPSAEPIDQVSYRDVSSTFFASKKIKPRLTTELDTLVNQVYEDSMTNLGTQIANTEEPLKETIQNLAQTLYKLSSDQRMQVIQMLNDLTKVMNEKQFPIETNKSSPNRN